MEKTGGRGRQVVQGVRPQGTIADACALVAQRQPWHPSTSSNKCSPHLISLCPSPCIRIIIDEMLWGRVWEISADVGSTG